MCCQKRLFSQLFCQSMWEKKSADSLQSVLLSDYSDPTVKRKLWDPKTVECNSKKNFKNCHGWKRSVLHWILSHALSFLTLFLSFLLLSRLAAHDCCEVVSVTLCAVSRDVPRAPEDQHSSLGRVASLAEHRFSFVQDLAFDMAQFLVSETTLEEFLVASPSPTPQQKKKTCHLPSRGRRKMKWSLLLRRLR